MGSTMMADGRVTIPERVRRTLGLEPGHEVEFEEQPDGTVLVRRGGRVLSIRERIAAVRGTATAGLTTDEIMAMTRGED